MRAVVQRVTQARVRVGDRVTGAIAQGLLVLLGVGADDTDDDASWMARRLAGLRIFPGTTASGETRPIDRSVREVGGAVLLVSQFTLYGDTSRGRRPSFHEAAPPDLARTLYERTCEALRAHDVPVETGEFQAMMHVELVNDGPVTILIDSAVRRAPPRGTNN